MCLYLNPKTSELQKDVLRDTYVDKSDMISILNRWIDTNDEKYVCVSRPRRFGKTMAARMICAYYERGTEARPLFEQLKLAQTKPYVSSLGKMMAWDAYLGTFDVIWITVTDVLYGYESIDDAIQVIQHGIAEELRGAYPDVDFPNGDDLFLYMQKIYAACGRQFVVVIDEWDAPYRERPDDSVGQRHYIEFLRRLFKDKGWIALAYMTGILPIKKYKGQSQLNMFCEYSMTRALELAPYAGFTEAEVRVLCEQKQRAFDDIKAWYDGYEVSATVPAGDSVAPRYSIYSPHSVIKAVNTGIVTNWWNASGTFMDLAEQINRNFNGLKDTVALLMDGGRVVINPDTYQNDMTSFHSADDVLTMLVHLGYLGFDDKTSEVFVPNQEVLREFTNSTNSSEWKNRFRDLEESKELLQATWDKDEGRVAELLEKAHDRADNKSYNSEDALKFAILNAYYAARHYYTVIPELDSGKGYVDVAYIPAPRFPEIPALVVELKWNKHVRTAINQIHDRDYPTRLAHYEGRILLVGINYNRKKRAGQKGYKRHSCLIEQA